MWLHSIISLVYSLNNRTLYKIILSRFKHFRSVYSHVAVFIFVIILSIYVIKRSQNCINNVATVHVHVRGNLVNFGCHFQGRAGANSVRNGA